MLKGKFIGVAETTNVFVVEKRFVVKPDERAVLRATALGLYFAELNGVRVGDRYLTPGWTSYNKMLQVQEYNVSALIKEGENVLTLTVGEGWYCGELTWEKKRNFYGEQSAVCADLVFSDKIISTDESWTARESVIRESGIYDGEKQDFTAKLKPLAVCEVAFDKSVLVPQISEPVRNIGRLSVKELIHTPAGELVYDFGQNMAGVVEIKTPEEFEGTLTLQFAEILVNGNFYTDNLRSAKATDMFTAKGAKTLCPEFTFHGFRYMKLTGAELPKENITAIVRHTDMKRTGHIHTSNVRFNRLMENVVWGQKSNFVDVPTDCPQRDERLGWTGDINAFCTTAAYNYDIRLFMKKWLADLRNEQAENGEIPHVCPDVLGENNYGTAALWCDVIVMAPWKLYRMYGDIFFLSDNYAAMQKYMHAYEKNVENGLVVHGFNYGDWLALDGEILKNNIHGRTDSVFLASAFYLECLRLVAETAKALGDQSEREYRDKYEKTLAAIRYEYITPSGRLASDTMTAQALALCFHIVPEEQRTTVAEQLNKNAYSYNHRVTTGFAGTPYLLFALSDNGYFDTACRILMNNGYPGWLYEVDMGATTVWERWNSLMPDGTPNPDGMNSYNHYAYGSVMEFVYRRIAGIETAEAGFETIRIAPNPCKGFDCVKAEYESVRGKIISGYEQRDGKIKFMAEIPNGAQAEIVLPNEQPIMVTGGKYEYERTWENLDGDPFTPESYVTEVFDNPKAVKAFNEVFGGIFTGSEIAWMKNEPKTLGFMAWFRDSEKKMRLADFPEMLKRANKLFLQ